MDNENVHLDIEQISFRNLLQNVICLVESQSIILHEDAYDTIETLIKWEYKEVCYWCELRIKLNTNQ